MRLRKDFQANEKLKALNYEVSTFPLIVNKNWVIELAMGKGEMITQLAQINFHRIYLGIEKEATVALKAAKRAKALNLTNFHIICNDIKKLPFLIAGKVNLIWLTFPDPWPKNRHEHRRLTSKSFLNIYKQLLTKDGVLKFKTDNDQLFNSSIESLKKNNWKIIYITNDLHNDIKNNENVQTGYEVKWSKNSKNINYLEAKF